MIQQEKERERKRERERETITSLPSPTLLSYTHPHTLPFSWSLATRLWSPFDTLPGAFVRCLLSPVFVCCRPCSCVLCVPLETTEAVAWVSWSHRVCSFVVLVWCVGRVGLRGFAFTPPLLSRSLLARVWELALALACVDTEGGGGKWLGHVCCVLLGRVGRGGSEKGRRVSSVCCALFQRHLSFPGACLTHPLVWNVVVMRFGGDTSGFRRCVGVWFAFSCLRVC